MIGMFSLTTVVKYMNGMKDEEISLKCLRDTLVALM